jgi:undecaprenyl-diphosphatase
MPDLPTWVEAVVLGLLQGLTEFLPVSSSGHLVVAPYLFGWDQPPLAFGVALHLGTLVAVVAYFRADLIGLARGVLGVGTDAAQRAAARRTTGLLAVATLPAAALGLALGELLDEAFGDPRVAGVGLFVTAALLLVAERVRAARAAVHLAQDVSVTGADDLGRRLELVTLRDAVTVGLAQSLALVPGISRAGSTIAAGMLSGLSRTAAARFSFLLSVPVIAGAGVLELGALGEPDRFGDYSALDTVLGAAVAMVAGFWAIRYLLRLVAGRDLRGFARYVLVLGTVVLLAPLVLGPPT